jgi:eukaryotic-like serine/threonine-protein kinase
VANFGERYQLIRRVGAGGMGEVWLAHDEQLAGRAVAIKIMHPHMLPDQDDVARFERETRFAAMMDHPNIVTVYTTGTWDGAPFMVMEYLRGQDLEKALPGGDADHIAAMGRDICGALAYAHRKGVLHRDIKPSNLFLCESGPVKVTDFGVARAVGGTALTSAGVLVGTFAYLPPERWRGDVPAFSNDIWAVGCVLYRLISGRLPRVLPAAADYAAAAARGDPIPDLRDVSDAPAWLTGPVMAMLASDPVDRPTAGDCIQLLSGAQFAGPAPGGRVRRRRPAEATDPGHRDPGPVTGAPSEDPAGAGPTRPVGKRTTAGRPWRPGRGAFALGGAALLLLAGSVTAWRLTDSPRGSELAARSAVTSAPASHGAGATATGTTAAAPRSSAAGPTPASASAPVSPAPYGSASPAGARSAAAGSSRPASPASSAPTSPTSPAGSAGTAGTGTAGATATAAPPLVAIPDVVGLTFTRATIKLENHGFTVVGKHTRVGQIVTRTNPSGEAPEGSKITVVYGTGAAL